MTDEEKKAIEYIKYKITFNKQTIKNIEDKNDSALVGYGTMHDIYKLQNWNYNIILNLIQKQQEELTRTKTDLQNSWHNNLELAEKCLKQDKIIDLMVNAMAKNHCSIIDIVQEYICNNRCIGNNDWNCEKCIKQYFEKQVERSESSK